VSRSIRGATVRWPLSPTVLVGLSAILLLTVGAMVLLPPHVLPGPAADFDASAKDLENARSALRGTILQSSGAVLLLLGAVATWRGLHLSRNQQQNDQFVRAIELLTKTREENGHEVPLIAAHIGAMHTLEAIMHADARYQPAIVAVLCAYIRQHSAASTDDDNLERRTPMARQLGNRRPAVWWALDSLMRRVPRASDPAIDLSGSDLRYARLDMSCLPSAHLEGADLRGCYLAGPLTEVTADEHTRWPKNFDPVAAGL